MAYDGQRDHAGYFSKTNPVFPNGATGIESNTGLKKVGDGVTAWNDLPYQGGALPLGVWLAANPVLAAGALGTDTDSGLTKIGDGSTPFRQLQWNGVTGLPKDQSAGLEADDVVKLLPKVQRSAQAPARGVPVTDNTYAVGQNTARTGVGTSRIPHTIAQPCTDLRLVYTGWLNNFGSPDFNDADKGATGSIKASVEVNGTIYRVTFGGQTTAVIDPGGYVISDPLPLDFAQGDIIYSRTFTASGTWHYTKWSHTSPGAGGFVTTTDLTAPGSGAVADSSGSPLYGPAIVLGRPLSQSTPPSVFILGDSIAAGQGDAPGGSFMHGRNYSFPGLSGGGFIDRALYGKFGFVKVAIPGDSGNGFTTASARFRRMAFANLCSTMVCEYGRNDLTAGRSLAQLQTTLLALWRLGSTRGMRVIQTTITPKTTSTDGWITTTNQTAHSSEPVRLQLNAWLRAGAPIDPLDGTAAAVGADGALKAGDTRHPLYSVWDVAPAAESATDSGLFAPMANVRTVADANITSGAAVLTSATANFTTADLGRIVAVTGAGAAGAVLSAMIQAVTNTTTVTVSANAGTTVTNAACKIGDGPTVDGTHPAPNLAAAMAAKCRLSDLA